MTRGDKDRLLDILSATTEVQEIMSEDLSTKANEKVKLRALERLIKNSRVMLAHEYFRISGPQVLDIAKTDIPFLQSAVRDVLERA